VSVQLVLLEKYDIFSGFRDGDLLNYLHGHDLIQKGDRANHSSGWANQEKNWFLNYPLLSLVVEA
jgi:hypothetical protein